MRTKDLAYKHGAWRMENEPESGFDKAKLMMSLVEKLKKDVEDNDPSDKVSQKLINELLYHYCWKMLKNEKDQRPT